MLQIRSLPPMNNQIQVQKNGKNEITETLRVSKIEGKDQ